ncbi:hypothetical protein EYF80_027857 [Liparis tanakae]|uniref:Uncharacterized protein n=1 Tax=Liparis tanakae TaxID=230148 RepID=A0A4Z2H8T1_9TELE|nr:hypothetical protein EYF80_027857 [Liparis tanakae]
MAMAMGMQELEASFALGGLIPFEAITLLPGQAHHRITPTTTTTTTTTTSSQTMLDSNHHCKRREEQIPEKHQQQRRNDNKRVATSVSHTQLHIELDCVDKTLSDSAQEKRNLCEDGKRRTKSREHSQKALLSSHEFFGQDTGRCVDSPLLGAKKYASRVREHSQSKSLKGLSPRLCISVEDTERGHGIDTKVSPQIKTRWQQLSLTSTPLPLQQSVHNNRAATTHRGKDNFPLWQ